MIREISQSEVEEHFIDLMGELECGEHFKADDPEHVEWVRKCINLRFVQGAVFHAYFREDDHAPIGFIAVLQDCGPDAFRGKLEILDFGFLSNHRGRGYGTELLRYVEKLGQETIDVLRKPSNHQRFRLLALLSVPLLVMGDILETITKRGPGVLSSTMNFLLRWCHGWIPTAESVPPIIIQHFRSYL